jgi:single-stranded-DNA-specific exonuclease
MRWTRRTHPDENTVARLKEEARISRPTAELLAGRGIHTAAEARKFLSPEFTHLHSPYEMLGMSAAAERLREALARQEKILIYGDYDVDGTLAVVILKTAIELCGGRCEFHVPHRTRDGYGMKEDVIERAAAEGVRLIISVDTGIRAFTAAERAKRLGMDLIVTDHHLPSSEGGVPLALAVLNPKQPGCTYPCKSLCGAGVAFKLAHAVMEQAGLARLLPSFLKVVSIATIADAVPLLGENRVFSKLGLEGLAKPVNPGLKALLEVAQLNGGRCPTAGDVAFRLAPRLNAAGRMDVAHDVVDLFSTHEPAQAREIAERLNQLNGERQQEEQRILQEVQARLEGDAAVRDSWCMVIDGEGWHKGVIGIVASRLLERYCRPVLVISRDGEMAQGSARSIEAFHMLEALESCAHLFTRYGGHAHAAGLALPSAAIPELRLRLDAKAHESLTAADLEPALHYDAELALHEITPELFAELSRMEPFGMGNPEPVFVARNLQVITPPRIVKDKHFKIRVRQPKPVAAVSVSAEGGAAPPRMAVPRVFDAMAWRMAERLSDEPLAANDLVDLAFCVVKNPHPDFGGLELNICDYRKSLTDSL